MNNNKPPVLLLIPFMLIGIILLVVGSINIYSTNVKTKDYASVEGKYVGSSVYSRDEDGTTYKLTYSYVVNNQEYNVSTNYGTGSVPAIGSVKTIKYNPINPSESVIAGLGAETFILFMGIMFSGIPLVMMFNSAILVGSVFAIIGGGAYYLMASSTNSLSIIEAFKVNGFWILIPILFVIVGIYVILAQLFMKKDKQIILTAQKIEQNGIDGNYKILFSDDNIADNSILALAGKYYTYETSSGNKFKEGQKYKISLYKHGIMFVAEPVTDTIQARMLSSFKDDEFIDEV